VYPRVHLLALPGYLPPPELPCTGLLDYLNRVVEVVVETQGHSLVRDLLVRTGQNSVLAKLVEAVGFVQ
jgi:hypothetical protein